MTADLHRSLAWLPTPPEDFRTQCRVLAESTQSDGRTVARLAGHALDEMQLRKLAAAIQARRKGGLSLAPLTPFKLGIVGNATLEPIGPAVLASAARHGLAMECVTGDYGQTLQEALSPDSVVNRARPDAVLLALDYRGLPWSGGEDRPVSENVAGAVAFVAAVRNAFRQNAGVPCLLQTLAPPPESILGILDSSVASTWRSRIAAFNEMLLQSVRDANDVVLDVGALAETVGLAQWYSPKQWNMAKFAFDAAYLPLYADHVARLIGALRGKSRKALILDLDNTIWGGIIGDDGIGGIVLGQGDPTGEAFLEVQRTALALRDRGILIAVSSKNDDEIAREPFRRHSEMLLREEHIAVFQANWDDKPTNIAAIARELDLGIDAMVFLDDNPMERALVREALPEVAVPELPGDPALFARTLLAAGYFETIAFSEEDRNRAAFYEGNARRAALQERVGDLAAYLASLDMRIAFRPFDAAGRVRITQLINKTNQFNLTVRRYTELDVATLESDPECFTLQARLSDTFGDNGMISVVICRGSSGTTWEIDTWLMSCRVLGRRVEQMVMRELLHHARARGIERLIGVYRPSGRNAMVAEHYASLGFQFIGEGPDGSTRWELPTDTEIEPAPMTVDRTGFELSLA